MKAIFLTTYRYIFNTTIDSWHYNTVSERKTVIYPDDRYNQYKRILHILACLCSHLLTSSISTILQPSLYATIYGFITASKLIAATTVSTTHHSCHQHIRNTNSLWQLSRRTSNGFKKLQNKYSRPLFLWCSRFDKNLLIKPNKPS